MHASSLRYPLSPHTLEGVTRSHRPLLLTSLLCLPLLAGGCRRAAFPGYPDHFRQFAYVANSAGNTVTVLDLVYLRPDRTLRVGENPIAVVASPKRAEAYVLNRQPGGSGSVSVIDTAANQVVATIPVRRDPAALSIDPTGHRAYIANQGSGTISVLDLDIRRQVATYAAGPRPGSALIAPDGRTLVVTHADTGNVSLFSAAAPDSAGAALTPRASFDGCPGATSPVILPDSSKTFVACPGSNQVFAISLSAAPATWAARQDASLLTDHPLALLDVGQNPTNLTLKPDGGEIFVSNNTSGSISEISTTTNEVGNTFPIGDRPAQGVISADNSALWVANEGTDSISLYSIDDGKLLSSLHTGPGPVALAFSTDKEQRLLLATDSLSGDVAVIRTTSRLGPALFTILPAGDDPTALAIQGTPAP